MRKSLPAEILQNLPEIVKREIIPVKLNLKTEESQSSRAETTARIVSMLNVNFKGETPEEIETDMNLATAEFSTFLRGYYLTGKEVIEAYRMALSGEFNYKVYPTLSLIQCGEILELYQEFKVNSNQRNSAIKELNRLLEPPKKEKSNEQLKFEHLSTLKSIFDEIIQKGFSEKSHILYRDLEDKSKLKKWNESTRKRFFLRVKKHYLNEKEHETRNGIISRSMFQNMKRDKDLLNSLVVSRCREIFVCNYLKKHCENFDQFKNALK